MSRGIDAGHAPGIVLKVDGVDCPHALHHRPVERRDCPCRAAGHPRLPASSAATLTPGPERRPARTRSSPHRRGTALHCCPELQETVPPCAPPSGPRPAPSCAILPRLAPTASIRPAARSHSPSTSNPDSASSAGRVICPVLPQGTALIMDTPKWSRAVLGDGPPPRRMAASEMPPATHLKRWSHPAPSSPSSERLKAGPGLFWSARLRPLPDPRWRDRARQGSPAAHPVASRPSRSTPSCLPGLEEGGTRPGPCARDSTQKSAVDLHRRRCAPVMYAADRRIPRPSRPRLREDDALVAPDSPAGKGRSNLPCSAHRLQSLRESGSRRLRRRPDPLLSPGRWNGTFLRRRATRNALWTGAPRQRRHRRHPREDSGRRCRRRLSTSSRASTAATAIRSNCR